MKIYHITVTRQGKDLTTLTASVADYEDSTKAITQIERRLNLNPQRVQMADNGKSKVVEWNGYEFCARRV